MNMKTNLQAIHSMRHVRVLLLASLMCMSVGSISASDDDVIKVVQTNGGSTSFNLDEVTEVNFARENATAAARAAKKPAAKSLRQVTVNLGNGQKKVFNLADITSLTFATYSDPLTAPATADAIDLGLSVKWASFNLGATSETEVGWLVGWGDNTGVNKSLDLSFYPSARPSKSIIQTEYDLASLLWEDQWRLPTAEEMEELITDCTWTWDEENNGYSVEGPNGNTLFIPATGSRSGADVMHQVSDVVGDVNNDGKVDVADIAAIIRGIAAGQSAVDGAAGGFYWTGNLASDSDKAQALSFTNGSEDESELQLTEIIRSLGLAIRPVYGEYVRPLQVSAELASAPTATTAQVTVRVEGDLESVTSFGVAYSQNRDFSLSEALTVEETVLPSNGEATITITGLEDGQKYYVLAYAWADGEQIASASPLSFTTDVRWIDLGLSVKWAKWNIGAESEYEYGGYYGWGDPTGTVKSSYESDYVNNTVPASIAGTQYDLATAQWGKGWRLPTKDEMQELIDHTSDWTAKSIGDVHGYELTCNGQTIFLPYNGYLPVTASTPSYPQHGYYWTATASGTKPWCLHMSSRSSRTFSQSNKSLHYFMRPVYDDSAIEKKTIELSSTNVSVEEGATAVVTIVSGIPPYTLQISDVTVAIATLDGNELTITGKGEGTAVITITDDENAEGKLTVTVTPAGQEAPPANAVDLGLYSGTLWASYNVGATSPEQSGDYFAWGELESKSVYDEESYVSYCPDSDDEGNVNGYYENMGYDIHGTEYDVAQQKWGGNWVMPSYNDFKDLEDECTWSKTTQKGVSGFKITGPNGNSIFLPTAGYRNGEWPVNDEASYWSCNLQSSGYYQNQWAYCLMWGYNDSKGMVASTYRYMGGTIRPVIRRQ